MKMLMKKMLQTSTVLELECNANEPKHRLQIDEKQILKTAKSRQALEVMERTPKMVDGHFQVALPWRHEPPFLPNNRVVAERRGLLLKKRLLKDEALLEKYKTTMADYIENGHAEKVPDEELEVKDRPAWYLPHHPVTHPLKPGKVRVINDFSAKYGATSLNQQCLLSSRERLSGNVERVASGNSL